MDAPRALAGGLRREALGRAAATAPLLAGAALLGAGATRSPALALAAAIGLVFVALVFRNLAAGLAVFAVLIFFEHLPGIPASGLSGVKVGGAVLAAAWIAVVLDRRSGAPQLLRDHPVLAYAAIALAGWSAASLLWAEDVGEATSQSLRLGQGVLLLLIVFTAVSEARHLRWLLWAFVSAAVLTALIGVGGATSAEDLGAYAAGRVTGQIGDPNELAAILVPALAFAAFAIPAVRSLGVRWLLATAIVLFSLTLFLTQSRGGLVALGVTLVAAVFLAGRARPVAIAVLLAVAAAAISYFAFVAPPEARERVTTFAEEGGGTGRPDLWKVALQMADDHPIVGVGAGNFVVREREYVAAALNLPRVDLIVDERAVVHNTYLHVLTELGAVGLAGFLGVVLGCLTLGARAVRRFALEGEHALELLGRGLLIGTAGLLSAYVFISAQYEKQLWLLLGAVAALSTLARKAGDSSPTFESGRVAR